MTTFEELGLGWEMTNAAVQAGWREPTPVQVQAIPEGIRGRDIIARAQTGTGKTGAYSMIVMSRIPSGKKSPSAIVIAPTRELALQVDGEMRKLSRLSGHFSVPIYGGAEVRKQVFQLNRGADIVVGTPGRIRDMVTREVLDLSHIEIAVIDEADRMFDMGFEEDLNFILDALPERRQTLMFSATMTDDVQGLAQSKLRDPVEIDVSGETPVTGLTKQFIVKCQRNEKRDILREILGKGTPKTIVFVATKTMVEELFTEMRADGMKVGTLHGDMPQDLREKIIGMFRDNRILTLLATDVAARGLDISDVDLVVNFDVPSRPETYLHRIGRTGRAGNEGTAISLVTKRDMEYVPDFEEVTDARIRPVRVGDIPPFEVFHKTVHREKADRKERERKKKALDPKEAERRAHAKDKPSVSDGFAVIQIGIGKGDGFNRTQIADFIRKRANIDDDAVGKVGLKDSVSFVEVSEDVSDYVIQQLDGCRVGNKTVNVTIAPKKTRYADKVKE
ncbi:Superfamily II DNA and RNA helicase [Thermoplasmatales archaeon BRNA1]|nr:Superfamily II DNA and RNA helicase [Thermoplasmatales archaeon BRNA1]